MYTDIRSAYENHPSLKLLSESYQFEQLQDFVDWLPSLKADKDKVIPLLVAKMLHGDRLALSMYESIYKNEHAELVLTYEEILRDQALTQQFITNGLGADSLAIMNAEHWLHSDLGRNGLCLGDVACMDTHAHLFS